MVAIDRGAIAARQMRRVEAYLGSNGQAVEEEFVVVPGGAVVPISMDPPEVVWSETPGGGREPMECVVFCAPGLIPNGTKGDLVGYRWVATNVVPARVFAGALGDEVTLERVFGRSL